jgi:hypothetical protein
MSESRLCGYCRLPGHRKPECPEIHAERNAILTHTPLQRKAVLKRFAEVGLGIGAMLKIQNYWDNNNEYLAYVQDLDFVGNMNFIDVRNIKYSKKVRVTKINASDMFGYRTIYIPLVRMGHGTTEKVNHPFKLFHNEQEYNTTTQIISASDNVDVDPQLMINNVHVPRRLLLRGETEYMKGFMPPD